MRHGRDAHLPVYRSNDGWVSGHTRIPVYRELLLQVCRDYAGLPDYRTLKLSEIRFFYEGLRAELRRGTKPRD